MIKKIKTFARLSLLQKIMLMQTFSLSVYTWVLFRFLKKSVRFGERINSSNYNQKPDKRLKDISFSIRIVNKYVPWKNVCRHQAYQAMQLCNYYKIPCLVFIGFKKDEEKKEIQAHAWTIAGEKMITGFCNPDEYIVQSIYRNKWQ